jgi:hypothetical protein
LEFNVNRKDVKMAKRKEQISLVIDNGVLGQQEMKLALAPGQEQTRIRLRGSNAKVFLGDKDDVAADDLTMQRVGDDLLVMFDGVEPEQSQLLLEGFYESNDEQAGEQNLLAGMGDDGQYHLYASSADSERFELAQLVPGGLEPPAQSLMSVRDVSGGQVVEAGSGNLLPILGGIGLGAALIAGLSGGGGGGKDGGGASSGGGGGGGGEGPRIKENLVDFNQPEFRRADGSKVFNDIGGANTPAVFVDGLRLVTQGRLELAYVAQQSSHYLLVKGTLRIDAVNGEMSAVSFTLDSRIVITVNFYNADGKLIGSQIVSPKTGGTLVSFTPPEGEKIASFTFNNSGIDTFNVDDINYTVDGKSTLVNFSDATYKGEDASVLSAKAFEMNPVFLGTLEISSNGFMLQHGSNGAGNNSTLNYLRLSGGTSTTFTLHKQNVYSVKFDVEFRGPTNEIIFYDANNNELGRRTYKATEGHGTETSVGRWEEFTFSSSGKAIAYFVIKAGNGYVSIDNISYPQTEGPPAPKSMPVPNEQDDVVDEEVSEVMAENLIQEGGRAEDGADKPVAEPPTGGEKPYSGIAGQEDAGELKPIDAATTPEPVMENPVDHNLSLDDLLSPGTAEILTADDDKILLANLKQGKATESDGAISGPVHEHDEVSSQVYEHANVDADKLAADISSQTSPLV